MKIIMYGVHDGEIDAIQDYSINNNVSITKVNELLDESNYHLIEGHDALCIQQSKRVVSEEIYKKIASYGIKQIALRTAGYDMLDLDLAKKHNLIVTNVPAYSPNAIAEMALTHTMYLTRKMYNTLKKVEQQNFTWPGSLAHEVRTLTVGIIGVGRIGSIYAKLVSCIGAKVIGYDILIREENKGIVEYKDSLKELLEEADVVSIHTPANESTINMINKETLSYMKESAYLINTARGPIVNSKDLIAHLKAGKLAGAGLDTIDCEVGYFQSDYSNQEIESTELKELLAMPNVMITPHISFYTTMALKNMVDICLDSALAVARDEECSTIVK